jgi:hypothetical protein
MARSLPSKENCVRSFEHYPTPNFEYPNRQRRILTTTTSLEYFP